jgi:hypothetical protein
MIRPNYPRVKCCEPMNKSQEPCTDNEGYGPAISQYQGKLYAGCIKQPLIYCPWCGDKIDKNTQKD